MNSILNKTAALVALSIILIGCKAQAPENTPNTNAGSAAETSLQSARLPALRKQFACLPKEAAIVAGHRGTSKKESLPENARTSLQALIDHGIMVAEVDVAGLKDGTHVLFHDGVWEDKTTGKGVVAATNWNEAKDFLLKDTDGDFSADRLITLEDALQLSKEKLYLEVDFKSSSKYEYVIKAIRDADMTDQVILIAYNEKQARKLASLAPEMLLSVGAKSAADITALEKIGVKKENMAIWMGRGPYDPEFVAYLDGENIPVLAWPNEGGDRKAAAAPAALLVTDYALQKKPIEGLSADGRNAYEACLTKN